MRSMMELMEVQDPKALLRHLVRSSYEHAEFNCFDAVVAFQSVHRQDPDGAILTAALLCTDPRWRRTTKPLITAIVSSGILDEEGLDELADIFLTGEQLFIEVPVSLLGPVVAGRKGAAVPLWRRVAPPLMGWAAAHVARRDGQATVEVLLAGLDDRRPGHAAAVLTGLIGVLDALPAAVGPQILDLALSWPVVGTRTAAIRHLHARGDTDRAICLASADPAQAVRRLGAKLQEQLHLRDGQHSPPETDDPPATSGSPTSTAQPRLFDG